jgi:hypothetical protein
MVSPAWNPNAGRLVTAAASTGGTVVGTPIAPPHAPAITTVTGKAYDLILIS